MRSHQTYGSQPLRYAVLGAQLLDVHCRAGLGASQFGIHSVCAGGTTYAAIGGVPFLLNYGGSMTAGTPPPPLTKEGAPPPLTEGGAPPAPFTSAKQMAPVTCSLHDSAAQCPANVPPQSVPSNDLWCEVRFP